MLKRSARTFLERLGVTGAEVSILVTTDAEIRRLNREWRNKNEPTDVLSFPAGNEGLRRGRDRDDQAIALGDVAISLDTARRRCDREGTSLASELSRYLAHGLLHLLGFDHERSSRDAKIMAQLEGFLLGTSGMLGSRCQSVVPSNRWRARRLRGRRTE